MLPVSGTPNRIPVSSSPLSRISPIGTPTGHLQNLEHDDSYNHDFHQSGTLPDILSGKGGITMVNIQKAGEVYMCSICGKVAVKGFGDGPLVCHDRQMQHVLIGRTQSGGGIARGHA
jgi:hypothetical protein